MIENKLIPTKPWHVKQCAEDGCMEWMFRLNMKDTYYGEFKNFPVYKRVTAWKCGNGHRAATESYVDWERKRIELDTTKP